MDKTNNTTSNNVDSNTDNINKNSEANIQASYLKEVALLKQIRSVSGITAEYLMTFLDRFNNQNEQQLIYSLCCNFHRLKHSIEVQLLNHGIHVSGDVYDPNAFANVTYVDVNLVEAVQDFLKEKESIRQANKLFVD